MQHKLYNPSSQTSHIVTYTTAMSPYLIFTLFCDVTDDVARAPFAFWVIGVFRQKTKTSDQIGIESRERHHCNGIELPNRLLCNFIP